MTSFSINFSMSKFVYNVYLGNLQHSCILITLIVQFIVIIDSLLTFRFTALIEHIPEGFHKMTGSERVLLVPVRVCTHIER